MGRTKPDPPGECLPACLPWAGQFGCAELQSGAPGSVRLRSHRSACPPQGEPAQRPQYSAVTIDIHIFTDKEHLIVILRSWSSNSMRSKPSPQGTIQRLSIPASQPDKTPELASVKNVRGQDVCVLFRGHPPFSSMSLSIRVIISRVSVNAEQIRR